MCICLSVYVCARVWDGGKAEPIRAAAGTSPPLLFQFGLLHLPPQWFLLQYKSQPALFSLTYTRAHTHAYAHTERDKHAHTRIRAQILLQLATAQSRLRGCTSQIVFQMCHLCMGLLSLLLALSPLPPVPQRDFSSAPASAASSSSAPSSTSGNWPVCLCS